MRYQVVLQFRATVVADYDDLIALEDALIVMPSREFEVDGHDMGTGQFNIFLLTVLTRLIHKESARGQGNGRKLIESVYEQARKAGAFRVFWLTRQTNKTAMKLHNKVAEQSGFLVYRKSLD